MAIKDLIIVRGAGDLATGTIHRLVSAGFPVLALETAHPAAIRRTVSFGEAIYQGCATVENLTAQKINALSETERVLAEGKIPLLIDPSGKSITEYRPDVVVDAILAKKNLGTNRSMAPLTIALGPGFTAGADVDYVIETMRGHHLGQIISSGAALPNTGIPGIIAGVGAERVIHAPCAGVFYCRKAIGDCVEQGEIIAEIEMSNHNICPVPTSISGLLRGILRDSYPVTTGFKVADIDPRREEYHNCFTISDKARCIAGSVLELVCAYSRGKQSKQDKCNNGINRA